MPSIVPTRPKPPRLLEIALRDALEPNSAPSLRVNEAGLAMLKEGYEGMANQLGEQMNDMKVICLPAWQNYSASSTDTRPANIVDRA